MSAFDIVHITPTPLVGAPGKLAHAQRLAGHDATALCFKDYPPGGPLKTIFTDRLVMIENGVREFVERRIRRAEIIHVHNFVPDGELQWLRSLNQHAKFVHHAHSPLREGPLFYDRGGEEGAYDYDLRLVVGQYLGRMYPDAVPVPNIVLDPPSIAERQDGEKLRVLFSPTHSRPGRWNNKHSRELDAALDALRKLGKIELVWPGKVVPPHTLMELRRSAHVTIDEIATGAFHQVSLEGLCAGCVTINRADFFSKATYASFTEGEMPPFVFADDTSIGDLLLRLADDPEETRALQRRSHEYYSRYCAPERMVGFYDEAYSSIR